MNSYHKMVNRVTEMICEHIDDTENFILIGDNSSGKSEILRTIIEKKKGEAVYYIDSVNRTFDAGKAELFSEKYKEIKPDFQGVTSVRVHPFNFNLQDTFAAASRIEHLYVKYRRQIEKFCESFLNKKFTIEREDDGVGNPENVVKIDGEIMTLSSGYQALIRIFCEILFFSDCMKVQRLEKGIVVIDEIDEYLSPKYSAEILNFLHDEFSNIHFIVTTHSLDLVETTENATIIVINKCTYATYTSEFLRDTVSANDIFTNLFFENRKLHVSDNDDMDNQLRQYLNSKVAGMWDEKMQEELEQINLEDLKPHQRLIFKQIKEW